MTDLSVIILEMAKWMIEVGIKMLFFLQQLTDLNMIVLFILRATALLLSVSHLVLVTRNACHMSGSLDWIDQSLHAAEDHMVVLREAALASEPERCIPVADAQREQAI